MRRAPATSSTPRPPGGRRRARRPAGGGPAARPRPRAVSHWALLHRGRPRAPLEARWPRTSRACCRAGLGPRSAVGVTVRLPRARALRRPPRALVERFRRRGDRAVPRGARGRAGRVGDLYRAASASTRSSRRTRSGGPSTRHPGGTVLDAGLVERLAQLLRTDDAALQELLGRPCPGRARTATKEPAGDRPSGIRSQAPVEGASSTTSAARSSGHTSSSGPFSAEVRSCSGPRPGRPRCCSPRRARRRSRCAPCCWTSSRATRSSSRRSPSRAPRWRSPGGRRILFCDIEPETLGSTPARRRAARRLGARGGARPLRRRRLRRRRSARCSGTARTCRSSRTTPTACSAASGGGRWAASAASRR